jgi:hemoglobin
MVLIHDLLPCRHVGGPGVAKRDPSFAWPAPARSPGKVSRRSRDRFASFLVGWLGGPDDYVREKRAPAVAAAARPRAHRRRDARRLAALPVSGHGRLRASRAFARLPSQRFAEVADFLRNVPE